MYSEVRSFMKKQHTVNGRYRSIKTSSKENIRISGNHLMYVQKDNTEKFIVMSVYLKY